MSWTGVCLFTINIGSFVPILTLATSLRKLKNNYINRGSYMSAPVLLNLLNELGKRDKM